MVFVIAGPSTLAKAPPSICDRLPTICAIRLSHRHEAQQPGANWVGAWYGRNLRIFNNRVRLTDRQQDRILAIHGYGHAYLLRQFAAESGAFRLVDVDAVLNEK